MGGNDKISEWSIQFYNMESHTKRKRYRYLSNGVAYSDG